MSANAKVMASGFDGTFREDLRFVDAFSPLIVLSDSHGEAIVAMSPAMQGRVLTSFADGRKGRSLGWAYRELIASQEIQLHINAFGGADGVWISPEAGQLSAFLRPTSLSILTIGCWLQFAMCYHVTDA